MRGELREDGLRAGLAEGRGVDRVDEEGEGGGEGGEEGLGHGDRGAGGDAVGRVDGGADGGEHVAEGEGADVAVDDDDLGGGCWGVGGEVGGEVVEEEALGAVAVQAGREALGELKVPLREALGVEGLEEVDVFGVRFVELAEQGKVLVVGEELEGGEVVGGRFGKAGFVLEEVLLVGREVSGGCG